mmetsp:Transcript_98150/g.170109  ORF Transcript_98150/g.170109 Transcript_98150/m.170109 type:complete len:91 (-) Transcript_98150:61-333(-)
MQQTKLIKTKRTLAYMLLTSMSWKNPVCEEATHYLKDCIFSDAHKLLRLLLLLTTCAVGKARCEAMWFFLDWSLLVSCEVNFTVLEMCST